MRNAMRKVSLLLVVLLLVAILPTATHASPPVGETHRHNWVLVSNVGATCTSPGSMTWRCTLCGQTYTESTPALGHLGQWVTTEATCTEEGLKSFTCIRCGMKMEYTTPKKGHTPVALAGKAATCTEAGLTEGQKCSTCGMVLKAQETIAALGHDWDEGKVTVQPWLLSPGERTFTCKRDPSHTRTEEIEPSADAVFASLSTGSWSMTTFDLANITPLVITEQPVGGAITRYGDDSITLHVAATGGLGEYTYEWNYRINGKSTVENILSWVFLHTSGQRTEPDFEAEDGNMRYWCKVTDEAGNTAQSETAIVSYKISIAKQPDNVNLQEADHDFYCEAIDGSGDYTYRWYDHDEGILGEGQSYPAEKEGYYYCIVTDNVTGETATSEYCEVYSTEPFHLENITQDCEVLPKDDTFVIASFAGGVEDYEIWWDKDGEAIDSVEGRDEQDHVYSRANVDGPGKYTVHGVDSMYATASGSVTITVSKLTIVEQPVGGTIPKGKQAVISVTVSDGEGPYTYKLFRNGEHVVQDTREDTGCSFNVWYPGNYYIHVEDSQGRMIDSNVVTFEDAVFRIVSQTESAQITKLGEGARLSVEVEGGVMPYTYTWTIHKDGFGFKVASYELSNSTAATRADAIGTYSCKITDKEGQTIRSKDITVTYTGKRPYIIEQPKSNYDTAFDTTTSGEKIGGHMLRCIAISGTGDDSNLRYDWENGAGEVYHANSRTIYPSEPGTYRCKVTDTATGAHTYSEFAVVSPLLRGLKADMTAQFAPGWGYYEMEFKGGMPIYTIYVYVATKDSGRVLYTTKQTRGYYMRIPLPLWRDDEKATYYFEVEDNYGRIIESGPIAW